MKMLLLLLAVLMVGGDLTIPENGTYTNVTTTIPVPTWNISMPSLNISVIYETWNSGTFGVFGAVLPALAVGSVFLKTRNLASTAIVLVAILGTGWFSKWAMILLSLIVFGALMALWFRSR